MPGGTRVPAEEREPAQSTEGASRRPHTTDDSSERKGDVHGLCQFVDHDDDLDALEDPVRNGTSGSEHQNAVVSVI